MLTFINRICNALCYSLNGLKAAFRFEWAFRVEIVASIIALPLALHFGHSAVQRALLIGAVFLVLIVELLNSAIETAVDRMGEDHHELSGRAKDIGAAAVLIALLNAAVIWGIIVFTKV